MPENSRWVTNTREPISAAARMCSLALCTFVARHDGALALNGSSTSLLECRNVVHERLRVHVQISMT